MPLDNFQKEILEIIRKNRTASSPFAGSSVIQYHGMRLSDDQDIFTAGDPEPVMRIDKQALVDAGLIVQETKTYTGFRECRVMRPGISTAILQWTQALNLEYFAPVPDPDFGQRLHFVDLAVNKTLAAANRMEERDFVDLWMLDRYIMPLWRMACAAGSKSQDFGPLALVERISFNRTLSITNNNQSGIAHTTKPPKGEPTTGLIDAIDKARLILPRLSESWLGKLQLGSKGQPVLGEEPVAIEGETWILPELGGALPTFEGIDDQMITALIAEYGKEGIQPIDSTEPQTNQDVVEDDNPLDIPDPFAPSNPYNT
ncbi:MAG: hypothetical protein OXC82_10295 [Rhodobacteraceae bacterium]|nr:hypothetical protein [Paracoccaceae bacterium]MCY4250805.1 hypothetical protein [Paracoccaceae bacterium]